MIQLSPSNLAIAIKDNVVLVPVVQLYPVIFIGFEEFDLVIDPDSQCNVVIAAVGD